MINKFLPTLEKFQLTEQQYIEYFHAKGEKDILAKVISNMREPQQFRLLRALMRG